MNLKLSIQLFSMSLLLSSCEQCSTVTQVEPNRAAWDVQSQHYNTTVAWLQDSLLISNCDENNKMYVRLGNPNPLASDGVKEVRIVNYNRSKIAADEITIDIAHGVGMDFLSSDDSVFVVNGTTYKTTAQLERNSEGKVQVNFKNATMRAFGSNGILPDTSISGGFIMER